MNPEDITIRPITEEDTELIIKWRNNPRVRDNFIFREEFDRKIHEKWLKEKIETGSAVQYIICEGCKDHPVGSVYFSNVEKGRAEYGIFIGEDSAVKKGIGTAAGRLLLKEGFEKLGFKTIYLRVFTGNIPAIKSYEKIGFKKVETLKDVMCSDGKKRDMFLMEISKNDSF